MTPKEIEEIERAGGIALEWLNSIRAHAQEQAAPKQAPAPRPPLRIAPQTGICTTPRIPDSLRPPQPPRVQQVKNPRFPVLDAREVAARCDPSNPACSFHGYMGNEAAVLYAMGHFVVAFESVEQDGADRYSPHSCNACILLTGAAGGGKTEYAGRFARGLEFKLIKLLGTAIRSKPENISKRLLMEYAAAGTALVPYKKVGEKAYYKLPRAVLFIDECHAMGGEAEEALLTMCESKDRRLDLMDAEFDCSEVVVVAATNKIGRWGAGAKSRFDKIELKPLSLDHLAEIVRLNVEGLTIEQCREIVEYEAVSREAIRFAETVKRNARLFRTSVEEAIVVTARMLSKFRGGMPDKAVEVLKALAAEPNGLSIASICASLGIEEEEFKADIVKHLLRTDAHPAYITVTNRRKITDAGREFLAERGLLEARDATA